MSVGEYLNGLHRILLFFFERLCLSQTQDVKELQGKKGGGNDRVVMTGNGWRGFSMRFPSQKAIWTEVPSERCLGPTGIMMTLVSAWPHQDGLVAHFDGFWKICTKIGYLFQDSGCKEENYSAPILCNR